MKSTLLSAAFAAASALGAHDAMAATLNIDFGYDGTDIYITGKGTIDLTGQPRARPMTGLLRAMLTLSMRREEDFLRGI